MSLFSVSRRSLSSLSHHTSRKSIALSHQLTSSSPVAACSSFLSSLHSTRPSALRTISTSSSTTSTSTTSSLFPSPSPSSSSSLRFFSSSSSMHATTILAVRKGDDVVVIGDGQVSMGSTVLKHTARKVRVLQQGKVVAGFAGSTADCFALLENFEKKLEEYPGQLLRAAVELAKMWRTDKYLRHLEAMLIAVDKDVSITLTGNGDVISEPSDGVIGIGSGGLYAVCAARALIDVPNIPAREVALKAMKIASDVCVYTNNNFTIEEFRKGSLITGDEKVARELEDLQRNIDNDEKERKKLQLLLDLKSKQSANTPKDETSQ